MSCVSSVGLHPSRDLPRHLVLNEWNRAAALCRVERSDSEGVAMQLSTRVLVARETKPTAADTESSRSEVLTRV